MCANLQRSHVHMYKCGMQRMRSEEERRLDFSLKISSGPDLQFTYARKLHARKVAAKVNFQREGKPARQFIEDIFGVRVAVHLAFILKTEEKEVASQGRWAGFIAKKEM